MVTYVVIVIQILALYTIEYIAYRIYGGTGESTCITGAGKDRGLETSHILKGGTEPPQYFTMYSYYIICTSYSRVSNEISTNMNNRISDKAATRSCKDGLCSKLSITASEKAMRCRYLMYVSTQYDDVLSRCLVTKPIVRPSEQPSDVRYLRTWIISALLLLTS